MPSQFFVSFILKCPALPYSRLIFDIILKNLNLIDCTILPFQYVINIHVHVGLRLWISATEMSQAFFRQAVWNRLDFREE